MKNIIETIDAKNPSREDLQALLEELQRLKQVDIRTVDKDTLVDIGTVKIDTSLPMLERLIDFIKQVKNPYCYKIRDTAIKVSFSGEKSINDCLREAMFGGGISDLEVPRYGRGGR